MVSVIFRPNIFYWSFLCPNERERERDEVIGTVLDQGLVIEQDRSNLCMYKNS